MAEVSEMDAESGDGVAVRTLVVERLPLLVAAVGTSDRGARLLDALVDRELPLLGGFLGQQLPRGARLGFMIDADELRLVDDRDQVLLRAPRHGLDPGWLDTARRLKGTMTVVVTAVDLRADTSPAELVRQLDVAAHDGTARGAIIGVVEDRPKLPLLFG